MGGLTGPRVPSSQPWNLKELVGTNQEGFLSLNHELKRLFYGDLDRTREEGETG